jgi:hypothetical protein
VFCKNVLMTCKPSELVTEWVGVGGLQCIYGAAALAVMRA